MAKTTKKAKIEAARNELFAAELDLQSARRAFDGYRNLAGVLKTGLALAVLRDAVGDKLTAAVSRVSRANSRLARSAARAS
jgi:hypothetical protein